MQQAPFFSIIIPTYNRAALLPAAVRSVLNQTFSDWELIVVDDGSTDNTREVINAYSDPRIRYLYQQNNERSAARNNGIRQSAGRYICFLDSDDYYLEQHLTFLQESIKASGFREAVFIADVMRDEGGGLKEVPHERIDKFLNNVCYILTSAETVIPARVCIHRNILMHFHFSDQLIVSEDSELLTRIGAKHPFIEVAAHTVVYRLHDENTTHRSKNPYASQLVALKMIFRNPALKHLIPGKIRRAKLSACYHGIAQYYHHVKNYRLMTVNFLKSIVLDPFTISTKAKIYLILRHLPEIFT